MLHSDTTDEPVRKEIFFGLSESYFKLKNNLNYHNLSPQI